MPWKPLEAPPSSHLDVCSCGCGGHPAAPPHAAAARVAVGPSGPVLPPRRTSASFSPAASWHVVPCGLCGLSWYSWERSLVGATTSRARPPSPTTATESSWLPPLPAAEEGAAPHAGACREITALLRHVTASTCGRRARAARSVEARAARAHEGVGAAGGEHVTCVCCIAGVAASRPASLDVPLRPRVSGCTAQRACHQAHHHGEGQHAGATRHGPSRRTSARPCTCVHSTGTSRPGPLEGPQCIASSSSCCRDAGQQRPPARLP